MDTKLKDISRGPIIKALASIFIVALLVTGLLLAQYVLFMDMNFEALLIKEYKNSNSFFATINTAVSQSVDLIDGHNISPDQMREDFYYYASDGKETFTNAPNEDRSFFEQYQNAFFYEDRGWRSGEEASYSIHSHFYPTTEGDHTIYIAFSDEVMAQRQAEWERDRELIAPYGVGIILCAALALLFTIYLILVAGRKPKDDQLHLSKLDRIYSDVLLTALFFISLYWLVVLDSYWINGYGNRGLSAQQIYFMIFIGLNTAAVSVFNGMLLLSLVRKAKAGRLIKHSFLYKFFYRLYDFIKSLFDGRIFEKYPLTKSLHHRQWIFIVASVILVFFTFLFLMVPPLFLLPIFLEGVLVYWYIKFNNKTYEDINKGFNESLEDQIRAERMKIALITNVSHDLKTPLTSIISYIDLLSKEEGLSETARDYVNILSDKSNRLKQIVADLFDLAKSTSGDIHLELESLDIKKLIEQTLGDMEDEIEKSGLQIRTRLPENPVHIVSDGNKLYRVFQNVLDNALKYSLQGTRIYVELEEKNGYGIAVIKNTSAYEMDFTEAEILQRFNRGDQSRSTEGSGLGLSIAQSFTHVTGGSMEVKIDGDLFKVIISFRLTGGDAHQYSK